MKEYKGRIFYGWIVVAACFVCMVVSIGIINNSTGVYVKPVCQAMGFSRGAWSVNNTLIAGSQMLIALLSGRIFARFDVKKVMCVGGICMALGYASYALAQNLPMFYISSVICGLSQGLLVVVSIPMLIANWFHARRGTAMGIAAMGSGVGGMLCNPLAARLIVQIGWRGTYVLLACVIFLVVVPACFFVIRTKPAHMGLHPLGETIAADGIALDDRGMTAKQARGTLIFWALCICGAINGLSAVSIVHNVAPHMNDVGLSVMEASAISSACMGALALGKLLLGYLYDRLGPSRATLLANLCSLLALAGMLMAPALPALALVVVGIGIGGAFGSVATPILAQRIFGNREFGAVLGLMSAFSNIGAMAGPLVVSGVYDASGSYLPAFWGVGALMCLVTLVYNCIFAAQAKKPAQ